MANVKCNLAKRYNKKLIEKRVKFKLINDLRQEKLKLKLK